MSLLAMYSSTCQARMQVLRVQPPTALSSKHPTRYARHIPLRSRRLSFYPVRATNGQDDDDTDNPSPLAKVLKDPQISLLLNLLVAYPGVKGSIAVALGFLVKTDPLGSLQWNTQDALIGILFTLPALLYSSLLILPNYEPAKEMRKMKMVVPRAVAEKVVNNNGGEEAGYRILGPVVVDARPPSSLGASLEEKSTGAAANTPQVTITKSIDTSEQKKESQSSDAFPSIVTAVKNYEETNEQGPSQATEEAPDEDLVELERDMAVRVNKDPFRAAMHSIQVGLVMNNVGQKLNPVFENILILLIRISEEMLYRGVILTVAAKWVTDNLYYAGAEDYYTLPFIGGNLEVGTNQLGGFLAAFGMTAAAVGILVQRALYPIKVVYANTKDMKKIDMNKIARGTKEEREAELRKLNNGGVDEKKAILQKALEGRSIEEKVQALGLFIKKIGEKRAEQTKVNDQQQKLGAKQEGVLAAVRKIENDVAAQQRWVVAIEGTYELLLWSSLSASYLFTGNILAPIVGSVMEEGIASGWQRLKYDAMKASMKEREQIMLDKQKETMQLLKMVKEYRKERLEPPKGLGGSALPPQSREHKGPDDNNNGGSSTDSSS